MAQPKFALGDKVIRNSNNKDDSKNIPLNTTGTIIRIFPTKSINETLYSVNWDTNLPCLYSDYGYDNTWCIDESCIDLLDDSVSPEERKQQAIIKKIKCLNERYANSRTVSTKVGDQKPGESTTSTTSDQSESTGIESVEGRILDAIIDAHSGLYAPVFSTTSVGRTYSISTCTWID